MSLKNPLKHVANDFCFQQNGKFSPPKKSLNEPVFFLGIFVDSQSGKSYNHP
jgi:hypothetical protein